MYSKPAMDLKVERAVAAERERCAQAVRDCPSLDENGYICQKSDVLKAILNPTVNHK